MKKISWLSLFIVFSFIMATAAFVYAKDSDPHTFTVNATIRGTGSFSFSVDGIYEIGGDGKTMLDSITWSSATSDKCYQQSDCYVVFRSTVTKAHSKIKIYTDVKNQNNYDNTISSYTGSLTNYFNGLIGQGKEESSYSVLPLAWHVSAHKLDPNVEDDRKELEFADKEYDIDGNKNPGNWSYAYMLDKSDEGFEGNEYATVQYPGHLRILGDPDPVSGYTTNFNTEKYLYIGCNFSNAMPTVTYAAVIILEAFTE